MTFDIGQRRSLKQFCTKIFIGGDKYVDVGRPGAYIWVDGDTKYVGERCGAGFILLMENTKPMEKGKTSWKRYLHMSSGTKV